MLTILTNAADAADAALPITYDIIFLFFILIIKEEIKSFIKTDIHKKE
jgi:hypothetical protein